MRMLLFVSVVLFTGILPAISQENDTIRIKEGDIDATRRVRRAELNDRIRPSWHLTIAEGTGYPFDPNGAIFKDGVYHLWHLYQDSGRHHWQHLSGIDLFHWRWPPMICVHTRVIPTRVSSAVMLSWLKTVMLSWLIMV